MSQIDSHKFDRKTKILVMAAIVFVLVVADQYTKYLADVYLKGAPTLFYFWETVQLRYAENTGAWGGLGSGLPDFWRQIVLVILPVVVLLALMIYIVVSREVRAAEVIFFSAILGGGIGNIIDRIIHGYVIDFLYVGVGSIGTNIFNIADMAIMAGTIAVIVTALWSSSKSSKHQAQLEVE